jgi:hypothetical protein
LLDVGQCNDAYSAIQIAVALADAFGTDVNGLPLSLILSLVRAEGRRDPAYPAAPGHPEHPPGPDACRPSSPRPVLKVLVDKFNIMPITTAEAGPEGHPGGVTAIEPPRRRGRSDSNDSNGIHRQGRQDSRPEDGIWLKGPRRS